MKKRVRSAVHKMLEIVFWMTIVGFFLVVFGNPDNENMGKLLVAAMDLEFALLHLMECGIRRWKLPLLFVAIAFNFFYAGIPQQVWTMVVTVVCHALVIGVAVIGTLQKKTEQEAAC